MVCGLRVSFNRLENRIQFHWLTEESSDAEVFHFLFSIGLSGHNHHWNFRPFRIFHLFCPECVPIHYRHHEINKNEIRIILTLQVFETFESIDCRSYNVTFTLE